MALLPSGYVVGTNGVHNASPTEKIGGTIFGTTDATSIAAGSPVTYRMPIKDQSGKFGNGRSYPIVTSGAGHVYNAIRSLPGGTFAYETYEPMIRMSSTKVNGTASTKMSIMGNADTRLRRGLKQKDLGIGYGTAFRAGYFSFTKISGQRSNWSTAPSALSNTFKSTTNNGVDSDDQGMYVTYRAVPGELVYALGSAITSISPKLDDYKAKTGG